MRWRRGSYDQQYLEKVWQESKRKELAKEIIDDPFLRMKKCKCSYICRTRLRVLILFLTVVLLLLLKLLKADWILFFHKDRYFVEPFLSTSSFVKNKYSYEKKYGQDKINCSSIYHQDPTEIGKSLAIRRKKIIDLEDEDVVAITSNCQEYRKIREYHLKVVSPEEEEFPLAYSLVVHKDAIMVERLIHTIYSTQNIYCIHYDQKSSNTFKQALENLVKCFSNIFIASKLEVVEYAYMSRLQADLNCLSDLLKSAVPWKYVINLCGQDFPLRSNFELVYEFKRLNGSNMLETTRPSNYKKKRFTYHYELKNNYFRYIKIPEKTDISKRPPPHNIEVFVGSAYFILCRAFVQYILGNSHVQDFLEWSKDTYSPDEHFWATLVRMPGVPGEISREAHDIIDLQSKTRLVKWSYHKSYPPCTGMYIRSVCIYGAAELRWLLNYGHWFANKFDSKVDPIVIKCLAEKIAEQQKQWVNLASEKHVIHKIFTGVS